MKNLFLYILVAATLVGIISPVQTVSAQAQTGTCVVFQPNVEGVEKYRRGNVTKEECGKLDAILYKRWWPGGDAAKAELIAPTATASACTSEQKPGWCTDKDGKIVEVIDTSYHFLEPLPCDPQISGSDNCKQDKNGQYMLQSFDPDATKDPNVLGKYLNTMIHLFLGLCAVLAVIMIVIGGIEYAGSELISTKSAAREKITGAIFGLVLALGAWTILYTINPDLLKSDPDIEGVELEVNIYEFKILDIRQDPNFAQLSAQQIRDKRNNTGIATLTGNCSVSAMTAAGFPNPQKASCVCQGESSGKSQPNVNALCADGSVAVTGLFQINMVAHQNRLGQLIPACKGVYSGRFDGRSRNCRVVVSRDQYLACANAVNNPTFNVKYALEVLNSVKGKWAPTWEYAISHCGQY